MLTARSVLFGLITLFSYDGVSAQEKKEKEKVNELKEVTITKEKKAIEQKADRTIFDFASQSHLNSGTLLEGLKKLPGLIVSEVAGMMYQGKQLEVYLDGRPLNIFSNELIAYLEGMPANSIEKVEVITQPGAEFPATSGGAIVNIITSRKAKKYLSATYSNGFNFTAYDRFRPRFTNSLLLNAKNRLFGWQLQVGQNYRETNLINSVIRKEVSNDVVLSATDADRVARSSFVRSAATFDLNKDRLLLNYDVTFNNTHSDTEGSGEGFVSDDAGKTKTLRQEGVITYQKRFDDKDKKLDFRVNYSQNKVDFNLFSQLFNDDILDNNSKQDYFSAKADYNQALKILDEGKFSSGILVDELSFITKNFGTSNLDYTRRTASAYLEFQAKYKKFDFILGGRTEAYKITGKTETDELIPFKQTRFFPNASVQYNFMPQIFFNMNYNKKIALPNTSALNPNNTNYQNPNVDYTGNPQLQPTIFDNFEVKISAFDYAFLGYDVSVASNQVVNRIFLNNNQITNTSINIERLKIHNINFGFPLPYMLFSKGLKETMKFEFNPDKINFLYLYTGYQYHEIPGLNTKGFWNFNIMSQIILPKEIKFVAQYNTNTTGGNYYYFVATKPFGQSLDLTFSKKFLKEQLSVALSFDDVLNINKQGVAAVGTPVSITNKYDTRRVGFTISYKIPTKNKLAKEDPNLLNKDKKEEGTPIVN
ncbi:outer membrane beta-barrel protein [Flavobacterium sp. 25HG05S-40]|uniref:outer membrane beta-barrel protein n=1 Tax=Flavobacterium sp. 25HG05S-40 TaxID=3458682 RepID=UPI004044F9B7